MTWTIAAQGDLMFRVVDSIPATAVLVPAENGRLIVGHSETGHNHVIEIDRPETPAAELYRDPNESMMAWLKIGADGALIEHKRSFDTHDPIRFSPGMLYEVRHQRSQTPEGWRRVQD